MLSVKHERGRTRLKDLRQAGSLKVLFPANTGGPGNCLAVLVNTAGGVTGGDCFNLKATAEAGASLTLTTQAAERAYRAAPRQVGHVRTHLTVGEEARLNWLPQETILFDGSALDRHLTVDLHETAEALVVEPLVFGRAAMGEVLRRARLRDRIEVRRKGKVIALDQVILEGDVAAQMARPCATGGANATANLMFISPNAEAVLPRIRALLPDMCGASLRAPDILGARFVAKDSHLLRKALLPVLPLLSGTEIPRPWTI